MSSNNVFLDLEGEPEEVLYKFVVRAEKIIDDLISKMSFSDYKSLLKEIDAMPKDYLMIRTIEYVKIKYSVVPLEKPNSIYSSGELDLLMEL